MGVPVPMASLNVTTSNSKVFFVVVNKEVMRMERSDHSWSLVLLSFFFFPSVLINFFLKQFLGSPPGP